MVNINIIKNCEIEQLYRDDLPSEFPVEKNFISDDLSIPKEEFGIDSATVNLNKPTQRTNYPQIIEALKKESCNYIKNLEFYFSYLHETTIHLAPNPLEGFTPPEDTQPCSGDLPDDLDDVDGSHASGGTSGAGGASGAGGSSGTSETSESDAADILEDLSDEIDDLINEFAESEYTSQNGDGYSEVDLEAFEAYRQQITAACMVMRLVAMLVATKFELKDITAEILFDAKADRQSHLLQTVNQYANNRVMTLNAQFADMINNVMEQNKAKYDEECAAIEDEHNVVCGSQKDKEEEMAAAAAQYEKALKAAADSLNKGLTAGLPSVDGTGTTEEELMASVDELTDGILEDIFASYTITENKYYDAGAEVNNAEQLRSDLISVQNLGRSVLILYGTSFDLGRVTFNTLHDKSAGSSKKDVATSIYEEQCAQNLSHLETAFSLRLERVQAHNDKVYHEYQLEKLEKTESCRFWAWFNRISGIVLGVMSIWLPWLSALATAATLIGSGIEQLGQYLAYENIHDEVDFDYPDRVEGADSAQQAVINELDDVDFVEKEDGLQYLDSGPTAELLGDLSAAQNVVRIRLAVIKAQREQQSLVQEILTGHRSVSNSNFRLVQAAYESRNTQYLFMFTARTYLKDQIKTYENLEIMQKQALDKGVEAWLSELIGTGIGCLGYLIAPAVGGIASSLCGSIAGLINAADNGRWAYDYQQLKTEADFTVNTNEVETDATDAAMGALNNLAGEEQATLQAILNMGFISTGSNGWGNEYWAVDFGSAAILRTELTRIANVRLAILLAERARLNFIHQAQEDLFGTGQGRRAGDLVLQTASAHHKVIGQQYSQLLSLKAQQAQLHNRAVDSIKEQKEGILSNSISAGLSGAAAAVGGGSEIGNAASKTVNGILTAGSIAANASDLSFSIAFSTHGATNGYGALIDLDTQQILLEAFENYYRGTRDSVSELRQQEIKVLTQITEELITSMQYGMWGVNSGLQMYFSSLMDQVFNLQEAMIDIERGRTQLKNAASQKLFRKAGADTVDGQTVLETEKAMALSLVSIMFSRLNEIARQHNKMVQAERELFLSMFDVAATIVQSVASVAASNQRTILKDESTKYENAIKDLNEATTETDRAAIENNLDKTIHTIKSTEKDLKITRFVRSMVQIMHPWVRLLLGELYDKALQTKYQEDGANLQINTDVSNELDRMKRETVVASLQRGEAALHQAESEVAFYRVKQLEDICYQSVKTALELTAEQIYDKTRTPQAHLYNNLETKDYQECVDAAKQYEQIIDQIHALETKLETNPEDAPAIAAEIELLKSAAQKLQAQVEAALAKADLDEEAKDKPTAQAQAMTSAQALHLDNMQQLQQSTSNLLAQITQLEEALQHHATERADPAANEALHKQVDEIRQSAAEISSNQVITDGLSEIDNADQLARSMINKGIPLKLLSRDQLVKRIIRNRQYRQALIERDHAQALELLHQEEAELQKALTDVQAGRGVVGLDAETIEAGLVRIRRQIEVVEALNPDQTHWQGIKEASVENNVILSELRNRIRAEVDVSHPKATDLEKSRIVEQRIAELISGKTDTGLFAGPEGSARHPEAARHKKKAHDVETLISDTRELDTRLERAVAPAALAQMIETLRQRVATLESTAPTIDISTRLEGIVPLSELNLILEELKGKKDKLEKRIAQNQRLVTVADELSTQVRTEIESADAQLAELQMSFSTQIAEIEQRIVELETLPISEHTDEVTEEIAELRELAQTLRVQFAQEHNKADERLSTLREKYNVLQREISAINLDTAQAEEELRITNRDIKKVEKEIKELSTVVSTERPRATTPKRKAPAQQPNTLDRLLALVGLGGNSTSAWKKPDPRAKKDEPKPSAFADTTPGLRAKRSLQEERHIAQAGAEAALEARYGNVQTTAVT